MKVRMTAAVVAVVTVLLLAGCGRSGTPGDAGEAAPPLPTIPVKAGVNITGSPTFDKAKQRGKLILGVKEDQPFLGYKDPATGQYSGFDVEIARMVAADLGFGPDRIEFITIQSKNRETAIQNGQIDYYVGSYTINDDRKKLISFAGPYFIAGQDLLVRKDDASITGVDSLKGKKICSATGSTSIKRAKEEWKAKQGVQLETVEFESYSQCVQSLLDKQVDAVTTDDALLKGFAAQNPERLRVLGKPLSTEPYGIGLAKDDKVLRDAINNAIEAHERSGDWKQIYEATLGRSGSPASEPPAVQRY